MMIVSKNILDFWFNAIEKQSIIKPSRYENKGYASIVVGDSDVIFLGEGEDAAFYPSLYCILIIYNKYIYIYVCVCV